MSQNIFSICNIVATNPEDYQFLVEHLGNYPLKIVKEYSDDDSFGEPTIVVGWNYIKEKFPQQNIFDKKLKENLFWTYSHSEDKKLFLQGVEDFFYEQIKKWLPTEFIKYDSLFSDLNFSQFCINNLDKNTSLFVYFNNGALKRSLS